MVQTSTMTMERAPARLALGFAAVFLVFWFAAAEAWGGGVVTWGVDLSAAEKSRMAQLMGIQPGDAVRELLVTNAEEHALLGETVPVSYLGTRAISSAYVRPMEAGSGLRITTHNITWVSKRMFAQALVTAGVRDAEVIAAAPVPVSGTAALTGIFKAFETASGEELPRKAKELAGEELYITREVGESIGHQEAGQLMELVKKEVVDGELTDREQIIEAIRRIAGELDVSLSERDIERIASMMSKLKELDLRLDDMEKQLHQISDSVSRLTDQQTGLRGSLSSWLQQLLDLLARLLEQFMSFAAGAYRRLLPGRS